MSNKNYDLIVNIGRYEPLHTGHIDNFQKSFDLADNVLVICGSSFLPRTPKNPFTFNERSDLIRRIFPQNNLLITGVTDYLYDENAWLLDVQVAVKNACVQFGIDQKTSKIAVIGHKKDESSYYYSSFPKWDFIDNGGYSDKGGQVIDATRIRDLYFNKHLDFLKGVLHDTVYEFLLDFMHTDSYSLLVEEYEYIQDYKKSWSHSPYPPIFMGVDAVVVQGGHVLMIRRGNFPGKGLWALPGGFLEQNETAKESVIRELHEETKLKMSKMILERNITYEKLFDAPNRSLRGRTLTQAFLFQLAGVTGDNKPTGLPRVYGSDDADHAEWIPVSDIDDMREHMFEDHYSIVTHMLNKAR